MKYKKSLFLQMILLIGFPSILIIAIIEGIFIYMLNQNFNQLGIIQNKLIIIFGMGLLLVICVMILSIQRFSRRLISLAEEVDRLHYSEIDMEFISSDSKTQLGELSIAIYRFIEDIKIHATSANAKKGVTNSHFEGSEKREKQDTAYIKNKNEKNIGFVEVITDMTQVLNINDYTNKEILRLEQNLLRLAEGNLEFDMDIANPNEYTGEMFEQFQVINKYLMEVKKSICNMIEDASMLMNAAVEGKLEKRADETKFKGSWYTLINGMNIILKEVDKPLKEMLKVLDLLCSGNLKNTVNGLYQGVFDELKQVVNDIQLRLNWVITEISTVTCEIGKGNLDLKNVKIYDGDYADISYGINGIIESLNPLLTKINESADQVAAGSNEVSYGSQNLAQGSNEQASSIQELTASITEIADQTINNAGNANKAREIADLVLINAEKGNSQMAKMQGAMLDINQSSTNISKIIKVIDDIAFQTNILALNAAVEAARAGKHGKGFAEVAEEVRTLAARSSDAAKETTFLNEGSIKKVKAGTTIADNTAMALNDIVNGVGKVTDLIGNIASASNEQASEIAQINQGIEQVVQVVQQNSATAEESAAASEELNSQAELLKGMINQFQLRK
ncbi:methyl-accepting chemotaxis protein [Acetobacterium bakii]|uniref:methyl-accepting chemotaxis protein n=1 Tax=Acetobacterium bakii TaxID=52689 RepID=UPI0006828596|nr:methyl-accepting chemotaxis protein [Acetobacterium bakii]